MAAVTEFSDQSRARATEFKRVAKRSSSLSSTGRLLVFAFILVVSVGIAAGAARANQYNLPEPQTIIAREIYDLHALIMWIVVGTFVVVFGAMTYAIIRHRKSVGREARQFHENTMVEIVWTIIPFLILIGMAYPAIKTLIAMKEPSRPERTIKAAADPAKRWTLVELKARGEKIYSGNCVACHQASGLGVPGTFPVLSGSKGVTGPKQAQINVALYGVVKDGKRAAMVSFKHLSDADIAALITCTRNSRANRTGDAATPAEGKSLRKSARDKQAAWRNIEWS
jgi:mono/diheme cytochrome c family protein